MCLNLDWRVLQVYHSMHMLGHPQQLSRRRFGRPRTLVILHTCMGLEQHVVARSMTASVTLTVPLVASSSDCAPAVYVGPRLTLW